ncbi:MAG: hypothetical protein ACTSR8_16460 [Promethearchaeota archaeon]
MLNTPGSIGIKVSRSVWIIAFILSSRVSGWTPTFLDLPRFIVVLITILIVIITFLSIILIKRRKNYNSKVLKRVDYYFDDEGNSELKILITYSEDDVLSWINLYEKYGSFRYIHRYLKEQQGSAPGIATMTRRIKELFDKEGRDFDAWLVKYKQKRQPRYRNSEDIVKRAIELYEEHGNYKAVFDKLAQEIGRRPDYATLTSGIKEFLKDQGIDYEDWQKKYQQGYVHSDEEILEWKRIFEKYGNYNAVVRYIEKYKGEHIDNKLIKYDIKRYFKRFGKDFNEWEDLFYKGGNVYYFNEEIKEWKELYEAEGNFERVAAQVGVHRITVTRKLRTYFAEEEDTDFYTWVSEYQDRSNTQFFEEIYSEEEVKEWIKLFEKHGSWSKVRDYLLEETGESPAADTIGTRIKKHFSDNDLDYETWHNRYFSSDGEKASNIGWDIQWILTEKLLRHFPRRTKFFYEIKTSSLDNNRVCDFSIINNGEFGLPDTIKIINIDVTIARDISSLYRKTLRGYHGKEKLLIILVLGDTAGLSTALKRKDFPYKNMVKIFNPAEFAVFIKIDKRELDDCVTLVSKALADDNDYRKIGKLSEMAKESIMHIADKTKKSMGIDHNPFRQIALEEYLENQDLFYLMKLDAPKSSQATIEDFME